MNLNVHSIKKIDFFMFSCLVVFSFALAMLAYSYGGMDFGVYYAAGKIYLQGGNPYDFQQLADQILVSTGVINNPYYYAPWFTWFVLPLTLLPFPLARAVWAVANFIFWFWGLFNLNKLVKWPQVGWRRWGTYLLLTFVFAWSTWGSEQVGSLIFFMFSLALLLINDHNWIGTGIILALLLFKPNITAIPVLALTFWMLTKRIWKPAGVMLSVLGIMLGASIVISPGWYKNIFQIDKVVGLSYTLSASGAEQVLRFRTTLVDWLSAYGIVGNQAYMIYFVAGLIGFVGLILAIMRSQDAAELTAFSFLISYALIPYALFYDYPSLVFPIYYFNQLFSKLKLAWAGTLMNVLITLCLFIGDKIHYRYWMIVVLVFSYICIKAVEVFRNSRTNYQYR